MCEFLLKGVDRDFRDFGKDLGQCSTFCQCVQCVHMLYVCHGGR